MLRNSECAGLVQAVAAEQHKKAKPRSAGSQLDVVVVESSCKHGLLFFFI